MRRKQINKAPTYHARLFNTEEEAKDFVSRMRGKMGVDYIYDVSYNSEYKLWHGRFWDKKDTEEGGYIVK